MTAAAKAIKAIAAIIGGALVNSAFSFAGDCESVQLRRSFPSGRYLARSWSENCRPECPDECREAHGQTYSNEKKPSGVIDHFSFPPGRWDRRPC